jgi:DNA-binding MarR family transcriptional regulator
MTNLAYNSMCTLHYAFEYRFDELAVNWDAGTEPVSRNNGVISVGTERDLSFRMTPICVEMARLGRFLRCFKSDLFLRLIQWLSKQIITTMTKNEIRHDVTPDDDGSPQRAQHAASSDNYSFSQQIGHLLRRAYQRHVAIFQQTIPDAQLTAAQFVVMCAIRECGSCSLTEIVKATAIDQATVRGIIERLKSRGLIEISHDASDRRKVLVTLSAAGLELVENTVPFAERITESTFGDLNPAERIALLYTLRKMSDFDEDDSTAT